MITKSDFFRAVVSSVFLVLAVILVLPHFFPETEGEASEYRLPYKKPGFHGMNCTGYIPIYIPPGEGKTGKSMEYLCLWTSGTYVETGIWSYEDKVFEFSVTSDGILSVEFITAICGSETTNLTTAYGVYYPVDEEDMNDYSLFGTVYWGYIPPFPSGWCWILCADCTWTSVPSSHGVQVSVDWASAVGYGDSIPPVSGMCGWPLNMPPPPFTISGL